MKVKGTDKGAAHIRLGVSAGLCPDPHPPTHVGIRRRVQSPKNPLPFHYTHQARLRVAHSPSLQILKSKSD